MVDFRRAGPASSLLSGYPATSMMKRPGPWGTNAPPFSGGTPARRGLNDPARRTRATNVPAPMSATARTGHGLARAAALRT